MGDAPIWSYGVGYPILCALHMNLFVGQHG